MEIQLHELIEQIKKDLVLLCCAKSNRAKKVCVCVCVAHTCVCITESLCCTVEMNTTL